MITKPFTKGQLVRVVDKPEIARIEHMSYNWRGQATALVRHPLGPTTSETWKVWLLLNELRHVSAVERLAEIDTK